MNREAFAGIAILVACCWGCAALFLGIGIWANHRKTPMHFWAGTAIDPEDISDISSYNRENGSMWMIYSVPFWLAGAFGLFGNSAHWCAIAALVFLALACFPGLVFLVRHYRKIEKKYISR